MGTKGDTDGTTVIFGSNAVTIMERIRNCPVLTIPKETVNGRPREIVFPTSYKTHIKLRELQYLIDIAKIGHASIQVLHISDGKKLNDVQISNKKLLEEYFEGLDHNFHNFHNVDVKSGLKEFVESRRSDMITFINKKHSFFDSIFSKPLVKDLGYHAKVPILTLHDFRN